MVEGTLQSARIAAAARTELMAMRRATETLSQTQQLLEAQEAARGVQERQLRQNLQEDARQALRACSNRQRV